MSHLVPSPNISSEEENLCPNNSMVTKYSEDFFEA